MYVLHCMPHLVLRPLNMLCSAGNWNSYSVGPFRDIIGDLFSTIRARGLHAGLYFSLYEWYSRMGCAIAR